MFSRISSLWSLLKSDPIILIYYAVSILLSLILHEVAHGWVAWKCGDPTAKYLGRLSLDPRKHLDPVGTVSMLLFGIGWAKPVPVNPRNFRHYRQDDLKVSLAGITMNLCLFLVSMIVSVLLLKPIWGANVMKRYGSDTLIAIVSSYTPAEIANSCHFNSLFLIYVQKLFLMLAQMNLSLAVFNLLPIPPLDGYHVLNDTILKGRWDLDQRQFMIVQTILIVVLLTGVLNNLLSTINSAVFGGVTRLLLLITGQA